MPGDKYFQFGKNILFDTILARDKNQIFSREHWKSLASENFFRLFSDNTTDFKNEIDAYFQIAKGSLDLPFCLSTIAHNIAIKLINTYGSDDQKIRFLEKMKNGDMIAAITNSEKGAGTDVLSMKSFVNVDSSNEIGDMSFSKIGSNIGDADLVFISAYKNKGDFRGNIGIFLIERFQAKQISHKEDLFGFKTGLTGAIISNENLCIKLHQQLGNDKSGLIILNDCFNLERLYIAAMIAGMLDRIIHLALEYIESNSTFEKKLSENQYIQEKIIDIYSIKVKIMSILHNITSHVKHVRELKKYSNELAILKIMIADEAFFATISFFEIFGYLSYTNRSVANKLVKDMLAFKFLGGSKEQQKMLLFKEIQRRYQ